jgi:hypothetical protein
VRWFRGVLALTLAGAASGLATAPARAQAAGRIDVVVTGGPLSSVTALPQPLTPTFVPTTQDYTVRCGTGDNTVTISLTAASGEIQAEGESGSTLALTHTLRDNEAVVFDAPDPSNPAGQTQYWVRCLPPDFPDITVTRGANPPGAGWYLTSDVIAAPGRGQYAMILDSNGTPVWYAPTPGGALDLQLIGSNTLSWAPLTGPGLGADPLGAMWLYHIDTQNVQLLPAPIPPMDPHELLQLSNGNRMLIASPLKSGVVLPPSLSSAGGNIVDCIVEEINPSGQVVWSWDAFDHIDPAENTILAVLAGTYNGQSAADIYHCNSIDVDPLVADPSAADVLVSFRNASAVVRINRSNPARPNGRITWKLGGTAHSKDGATIMNVFNDPETSIYGQHDARFEPGGAVSLYDDRTGQPGPARAVQYTIDVAAATATLALSFPSPDGNPAGATGSFRRYANGADNVIGWGVKPGVSMSEVDAAGAHLLDITLGPPGTYAYRFQKVALGAIDANLLRQLAGIPPAPPRSSGVVLDGWGGLHPFGPTPVNVSRAAYWPGWDIARGVTTTADSAGGYSLDGWGGIHAFGNAPDAAASAYWAGWDIARGIALCPNTWGGYTVDGWGGVHAFGTAPAVNDGTHAYWAGWDIVRGIVVKPDCQGGYTLDGWGGVHNFGNATPIADNAHAYWGGWDIARAIVLRADGSSGFVLDGWGGVHGFGGVTDPPTSAYWLGWDIARGLTLAGDARSGYVVDGWGGLHSFGSTPPVDGSAYWPGWEIARAGS